MARGRERRIGTSTPRSWPVGDGRYAAGRRVTTTTTTTTTTVGALAALVTVAVIRAMPGLVDVGFLGRMAYPLPVRLALHLPLAVAFLASGPAAFLVVGALRHWWIPRIRPRDAALAVALTALAAQLASWHLVAWGL